jgi:cystathionine beta-lyase family protein involved in aluminum resistance
MKEPYAVYFQGGITYPHAKYAIMLTLEKMKDKVSL